MTTADDSIKYSPHRIATTAVPEDDSTGPAPQSETPRMSAAVREGNGIAEGCKLEQELASAQAEIARLRKDMGNALRECHRELFMYRKSFNKIIKGGEKVDKVAIAHAALKASGKGKA